jgi:hypothetical protein
MLARRLLVLAAVLLALGAVAASLAPRDLRQPGPTTNPATAPPPAPPAVRGRDITLAVDAAAAPATVAAGMDDHVHLTVRAQLPDAVSIPALGYIQPVDAYSPAVFDFVADRAGRFPILLAQSGRRVATLRVTATP